jgi:putative ABC transport system substrate-binding protein
MNNRRKLIIVLGAGALTVPLGSFAQQQGKIWRIGFIGPNDAASSAPRLAAFNEAMRDNGLVEGTHYVLDAVYADGEYARFPALTREILQRNPAVIMLTTIPSVRAVQQATSTVPILFIALNDPVASGVVASLARPGGNTTGQSTQADDTMAKYVELLHEILPRAKRIAVLINPDNSSGPKLFEQARIAGTGFGIGARVFEAATPAALDGAFAAIAKHRPDALVVVRDANLIGQCERISAFALKSRIPAFGPTSEFVDAGSVISYAPSLLDMYRRSAIYVKKILAGAKPADLPVEQPTKFEMVINMKTAKALGIKVPNTILVRATKVIE